MLRLRLSSKGRQEFGAWSANRLVIGSGGAVALVLIPALTGKAPISGVIVAGGWVAVICATALAALVKYLTVERAGESMPFKETADA